MRRSREGVLTTRGRWWCRTSNEWSSSSPATWRTMRSCCQDTFPASNETTSNYFRRDTCKGKIYASYRDSLKESETRLVGQSSFFSLWQQLTPLSCVPSQWPTSAGLVRRTTLLYTGFTFAYSMEVILQDSVCVFRWFERWLFAFPSSLSYSLHFPFFSSTPILFPDFPPLAVPFPFLLSISPFSFHLSSPPISSQSYCIQSTSILALSCWSIHWLWWGTDS